MEREELPPFNTLPPEDDEDLQNALECADEKPITDEDEEADERGQAAAITSAFEA